MAKQRRPSEEDRPRRGRQNEEPEEDRPVRNKKKRKKTGGGGLVIGLILGGMVLIGGGVVGLGFALGWFTGTGGGGGVRVQKGLHELNLRELIPGEWEAITDNKDRNFTLTMAANGSYQLVSKTPENNSVEKKRWEWVNSSTGTARVRIHDKGKVIEPDFDFLTPDHFFHKSGIPHVSGHLYVRKTPDQAAWLEKSRQRLIGKKWLALWTGQTHEFVMINGARKEVPKAFKHNVTWEFHADGTRTRSVDNMASVVGGVSIDKGKWEAAHATRDAVLLRMLGGNNNNQLSYMGVIFLPDDAIELPNLFEPMRFQATK